jgi:microcin C transport system permease protein
LGTDDKGRDIFARVLYGIRISILFGLILTAVTLFLGVLIGGIQGYFGGKLDLIGQRITEIWAGMPVLFIIIILSDLIEPTFWSLLAVISLFSWMHVASLVRAEFLKVRNYEFVQAAKIMGASHSWIIRKHMIPNGIVSVIAYFPFLLISSIVTLTSLDFLGFGLPIESASLGELLNQAKNNIHAPWIGMTIFAVLSLILVTLVFIGEGIRDALDYR